MQQYALVATSAGLVVGVVGLVLVGVYRRDLGRSFNGFWSKWISVPMQVLSLLSSAGAAFDRPEAKADWVANVVVGIAAFAVWTTLQILVDYYFKEGERFDFERLEDSQSRNDAYIWLFGSMRKLVDFKLSHIRGELDSSKGKPTVKSIRECLRTGDELDGFLTAVCQFYIGLVSGQSPKPPNFRAVLYVSQGGYMTPIRGSSHNDNLWEPSPSFEANHAAFALTGCQNPALVTVCINRQATIMFGDTLAASDRGEFEFLHADQRSYLRSIIACPLGKVWRPDRKLAQCALVVDTNVPDFFLESDRPFLEFCLREFASRIKLELMLEAMLTSGEGSP